ncbi:hypothetical protein B0H67DRAFT_583928 [Lasiosphaeris hirsuta]|uniref:Uncharacterized protein n=1 Tax=Lasiosphaeris hirsuta TaxID=260670 RepID=A0AA40A805_9PEZI|nr:hypothetical protein B0H67DRAFT_583928 [Lasiosphaeris hirsuta]
MVGRNKGLYMFCFQLVLFPRDSRALGWIPGSCPTHPAAVPGDGGLGAASVRATFDISISANRYENSASLHSANSPT